MTAAHAAPVVVHGWTLYAHPLCLAQLETLASQLQTPSEWPLGVHDAAVTPMSP
jgi:hypothetical protein